MKTKINLSEVERVCREERAAGRTVGYVMVCPREGCGFHGTPRMFDESLASECWCPKCGTTFLNEPDEESEDE